jgi:hypothetical protein
MSDIKYPVDTLLNVPALPSVSKPFGCFASSQDAIRPRREESSSDQVQIRQGERGEDPSVVPPKSYFLSGPW